MERYTKNIEEETQFAPALRSSIEVTMNEQDLIASEDNHQKDTLPFISLLSEKPVYINCSSSS
jgi:hypothetical protein